MTKTLSRLRSSLVTHVNSYVWFLICLQWGLIAIGYYYEDKVMPMLMWTMATFYIFGYAIDVKKKDTEKLELLQNMQDSIDESLAALRNAGTDIGYREPIKMGKNRIDLIAGILWIALAAYIWVSAEGHWYNFLEAITVYVGGLVQIYAGTHEVAV